jgi:hypothetical protein
MIAEGSRSEIFSPLKYLIAGILVILIASTPVSAQKRKEPPPPLRERIFFGGSFGLQFGTYTNIEINPIVGLWVFPNLAVAAGPGYQYFNDKTYNVSTDIFSAKAYIQLVLLRDIDKFIPLGVHTSIILHGEDEMLNLETEYWKSISLSHNRFWVNSLLAGGGLSQQIGKKGAFNILVLWVLTDSGYSLYSNPEIRIGFTF